MNQHASLYIIQRNRSGVSQVQNLKLALKVSLGALAQLLAHQLDLAQVGQVELKYFAQNIQAAFLENLLIFLKGASCHLRFRAIECELLECVLRWEQNV